MGKESGQLLLNYIVLIGSAADVGETNVAKCNSMVHAIMQYMVEYMTYKTPLTPAQSVKYEEFVAAYDEASTGFLLKFGVGA